MILMAVSPGCSRDSREPVSARPASPASRECDEGLPVPEGPRSARLFDLRSEGGRQILEVRPAEGSDPVRYLLVRKGCPADSAEGDFEAVIEVPVTRFATTSTTEIAFFEILESLETLVAHSGMRYVSNREVRERHRQGDLTELGSSGALDLERLVGSGAQVVLASPGGDPWLETLRGLDRADTVLVEFPSFREASALGRAEWIRVLGALLGRGGQAERWFAEIEGKYGRWREIGEELGPGPRVVTGAPAGGMWFAPAGESFLAGLLRDSGARSVWSGIEGSGAVPLDLEVALERSGAAEVWLQPGVFESVREMRRRFPRLSSLPALASGSVWTNDARRSGEANDYWETGAARPDLVLADFLAILFPARTDHEIVFHRRLPAE